jgi:hypothetical protein
MTRRTPDDNDAPPFGTIVLYIGCTSTAAPMATTTIRIDHDPTARLAAERAGTTGFVR